MQDKRLLDLNNERLNNLLTQTDSIYSNHDIWHNLIPVYADHFILHHPDAPLSYGGRLPSYVDFGRKMRLEKEEYEIGVAMAHTKTQQERFAQNPSLRKEQEDTVIGVLDELPLLRSELLNVVPPQEIEDIIDFLSSRIVSKLYNTLPAEDPIYETIDAKLKSLNIPKLKVSIHEVAELMSQQKLIANNMGDPISHLNPDFSREIIASIDPSRNDRESGSEYIVQALKDFGMIDAFLNGSDEISLEGLEKVRWVAMIAPQRTQLKGHMEKVHGKSGEYKFGNTVLDDARQLVHLQQAALQEDTSHYLYRSNARKESQQISYSAYSLFFDDGQSLNRTERVQLNTMLASKDKNRVYVAKRIIEHLDEIMDSLVKASYSFQQESISSLKDIAAILTANGDNRELADTLSDLISRYEYLLANETVYQKSIGITYTEAKNKTLDEQMDIG